MSSSADTQTTGEALPYEKILNHKSFNEISGIVANIQGGLKILELDDDSIRHICEILYEHLPKFLEFEFLKHNEIIIYFIQDVITQLNTLFEVLLEKFKQNSRLSHLDKLLKPVHDKWLEYLKSFYNKFEEHLFSVDLNTKHEIELILELKQA